MDSVDKSALYIYILYLFSRNIFIRLDAVYSKCVPRWGPITKSRGSTPRIFVYFPFGRNHICHGVLTTIRYKDDTCIVRIESEPDKLNTVHKNNSIPT